MSPFLLFIRHKHSFYIFGIFIAFTICLVSLIVRFSAPESPNILSHLTARSWTDSYLTHPNHTRWRQIYFFNWTNHHNYLENQTVPHFEEVGPIIYKVIQNVTNVDFEENMAVYESERKFVCLNSSSELDVNITSLNDLLVTVLWNQQNGTDPLIHRVLDFLIEHKEPLAATKSIIEILKSPQNDNAYLISLLKAQGLRHIKITPDVDIIMERKTYSIYGTLIAYEDQLNTTVAIPEISDPTIHEYEPHLRRLQELKRNSSDGEDGYTVYEGFDGCSNNCPVTSCMEEPITVSQPHFLGRKETPNVLGMNPNLRDHQSISLIDQVSGMAIMSNFSYQVNIKLTPISWSTTNLRSITAVEIPIFWYKDTFVAAEQVLEDLTDYKRNQRLVTVTDVLLVLSSVPAVICIILLLISLKKRKETELLAEEPI